MWCRWAEGRKKKKEKGKEEEVKSVWCALARMAALDLGMMEVVI